MIKLKNILLSILIIFIFNYSLYGKSKNNNDDNLMRDLYILNEAVRYLHDYYYDEIPSKKMIHNIIASYMETLDPHTNFIEKQRSKEMKMQLKGKYGGVGIVIGLRDNELVVVSPFEDTPADRAGLKPQDKILKVDGKDTSKLKLDEVADLIRGPVGTKVILTIQRDNDKPFNVVLIREEIKLKTVKSTVINKNIGYLRISQFNGDTSNEVLQELINLNKKNIQSLIIDLRNNPGGLLSEAVKVSDFFLPEKSLIVYTKGRIPSFNDRYYSERKPKIKNIPIIVMINQGTASGAEILAGALRDNNRAILIGMKTYGKGSVQNIFNLSDGSSMKITIAHYYTPNGICIDGKGIKPDIEVPLKEPEDLVEKLKKEMDKENNENSEEKKNNKKESTKKKNKKNNNEDIINLKDDYQLKKAVELLKVYKILAQKN